MLACFQISIQSNHLLTATIVSTVPTSLKVRSCSKVFSEMNGNLMAWYVASHSSFSQLLLNYVGRERLVSLSLPCLPFCFQSILSLYRFGTYDVDHALNAGLDLEMPGVSKWRTRDYVNRSIEARKLTVTTIKQRVKKVLELIQKCARRAPEVSVIPTSS